ncbi:hemicentin-1-like isoform X2 [Montipora capricornis]|uniref:hemicentin-1-like isoform X2 n=1 Tax=Montipora capricornis TaxID=246305 RepID=UPI0035F103B8
MRESSRKTLHWPRVLYGGIFTILFVNASNARQQETPHPDSFSTLLNILDDNDEIRERRDALEDYLSDEAGSGNVNGKGPDIILSEQKKFVLRTPGKLLVDVGCTVFAVKNTEITVACRANSTSGSTKIEWLKNGFQVSDRFIGDVAAISGSLQIRKLGRFNEGSYTCRASNDEGETDALFTAKIVVPFLPTILKAKGSFEFGPNEKAAEITIGADVTVYRGATLVIRCPVEGADDAMVYWTSRGKAVAVGKAVKTGNDLVISDIDGRYALPYTCTARTSRGRDNAESNVYVKDLAPPNIKSGTEEIRITDEETTEIDILVGTKLTVISETLVKVRCEASMDPSPTLSWEIQGKNSDFKDAVSLSEDNSTLTLSDPGEEDSGIYKCVAVNNVGQDSESSTIDVLRPDPPRIFHSERKLTLLKINELLEATIGDQVTMLAGGNVIITCRTSGLPTPTIKWKKDGKDISVNKDRLEIRNATDDDSGDITCEATNRAGIFSFTSKLRVIGVEKPEIQSSSGRVIGVQGMEEAIITIGQDLRVVEGLIVRLVCPVSKGFPPPSVTWFLNDRLVISSQRFLINTRSNSLTINGINMNDTGQVSCVASNGAGHATESSFVGILGESTAKITPGNSSVEFITGVSKLSIRIGDTLKVIRGSEISVDCIAHGTPPPITNWRLNGSDLRSGALKRQLNITELSEGSRLTIKQLTSQDSGWYECIAINTGGPDRTASSITVLDATFPRIDGASDSIERATDLQPISIQIGTSVTLLPSVRLEVKCPAWAIPDPSIVWFRQGKQITPSERFLVQNDTLIIQATQLSDSGAITCSARNTMGKVTVSSTLKIIEPIQPRITETGNDLRVETMRRLSEHVGGNILCRIGVYLELTCTAQGTPTPEIVWLRGNTTRMGSGSKLTLGILKEENSGDYTCVASNLGGEDRKTTKLNVISSIVPVIQSSSEVIEYLEEGRSLVATIGTRLRVIRGAQIELICPVSGFPTPNVDWVKGNELVDQRFERQGLFIVPYNGTSSTLLIRGSDQFPKDVVFGCNAYNVGGSVSSFSYVTFYDHIPPVVMSTWRTGSVGVKESLLSREPVKVTIGDNVRIFTKTKLTIECPVKAIPLATVTWTFGMGSLPRKHQTNGTNLVLSDKSDTSDSGRYQCIARNPLGRDSSWSDVTFLEPTMPSITKGDSSVKMLTTVEYTATIGSDITTIVGSNITFVCVSYGRPSPSVSWLKDDEPLNSTGTLFTMYAFDTNATGNYSCVAENLAGLTVAKSAVKIYDRSIQSATVPRIITSRTNQAPTDNRRLIEQTVGGNVTIVEGRDLLLRCPAEGSPLPTISWLFNGNPVEISDTFLVDDVTGDLKIIEMIPEEAGIYTCIARNIAGETREVSYSTVVEPTFPVIDYSNASIEVFDPARKVLKVKIGSNVTTLTGTPVDITCNASGFPVPKISWIKGFTAITGSDSQSLIVSVAKINLLRASRSDSGLYKCTASSQGGRISAESNITFVEPVMPRILYSTREQKILQHVSMNITIGEKLTVLDKSNVTIVCKAEGIPSPTLSWSKDGFRLPENLQTSVLHLTWVTLEDAGRYICTVENYLGSDSQSVDLSVTEPTKPRVKVSESGRDLPVGDGSPVTMNIGDNVTAASNTSITIRCPVSGVPTPTVTWTKDGRTVVESENLYIRNQTVLVIHRAEVEDSAKYSCITENKFGREIISSIMTIKGQSKPTVKIRDKPTTVDAKDRSPLTLKIGDNVTALTNTSITIQCPTRGIPTPIITWTRNGQQISSGDRFKVLDDGSLLISEVNEEDSAVYSCKADSVAGEDRASTVVQVKEPAKPVIDIPASGKDIPLGDGRPVAITIGDNVTAASNTSITITCPVSGVPTPSVTWRKDGTDVVKGEKYFMNENNSLVIRGAEPQDSANYSCVIQSAFGTEESFSRVIIKEPIAPQIFSLRGDFTSFDQNPVNITIGQKLLTLIDTKLVINCPVKGIPIPKVTWTKGNETLPSDGRMTVKNGNLVIVELQTSDSGKYTCSSENSVGKAAASSNVTVAVPSPPEIIQTGIEDDQVVEPKSFKVVVGSTVLTISGNNVSLTCQVDGFPPPSLQWTKDGSPLKTKGSILLLKALEIKDSGEYTCTATSSLQELSDSASTNLTVVDTQMPIISTKNRDLEVLKIEDLSVAVGGVLTTLDDNKVTLVCESSGIPDPQITWEKDGAEVQKGGKFYTIETAVRSDSGNYTCVATNIAGRARATSQLIVLVGSAPKIVSSRESLVHMRIDVFSMTVGSNLTTLASPGLEIGCPATGFPKPAIQWYREGTPVKLSMMLNVDEDTGTLFILSISHRKGGTYTCVATNVLGSDSASSLITVLVPEAPKINVSRSAVTSLDSREPVSVIVGQRLDVLSGTNVSIECPVSGIPEPEINWKRQDGALLAKDSILTIDSVSTKSSGEYVCRASNLAGDVMAGSVVTVKETSPPKISAVFSSLKLFEGGSFKVNVGSNVTTVTRNSLSIRCNTTGVPPPEVTWSKDGALLETKGPVFVLSSLSTTDSGRYRCTASNVDGSDAKDIRIDVLVGSQPEITSTEENVLAISGEKEVTIGVGGNLTTVVGTGVKILCPVTALPNATVSWLFNGSSVEDENRRWFKNGEVTMTGVTPQHVGSYTCVAKNSYGSDLKATILSLIIPVEPKILSSNMDIQEFNSVRHDLVIGDRLKSLEGSIVHISCPATGNPTPNIEWKKSGVRVKESGNLKIVNNTLILLNSTSSDSGSYTCVASSGAGSDEEETFLTFSEPEKPSIRGESINVESYDMQPVTVTVGSTLKVLEKTTVNIRCIASGIPEPSVYWDSSSSMQPANKFDVNQGGQLLTIREVDASDSGKYMCNAFNKAGEVTEAALVKVVEATTPTIKTSDGTVSWYNRELREVPVGGKIQVLSGTKVTLTCEYSGFPQPEVKWSVLDEEGQVMEQDAGFEVVNGSLVLMALQPSDSAEYVCSVRNVAGTASASTKLKIFDPQSPSIISSEDSIVSLSEIAPVQATAGSVLTVLSGTKIVITCSAEGVPTPSVAWTKGDKLIHTSYVLTIENATVRDSGDYLCTAMSEVGSDQESTMINVVDPRRPIIQQPNVHNIPLSNRTSVNVLVGSDVTVLTQTHINITCQVDGVPTPEITWLRNGKPVKSKTGNSLEMTISAVEDAGQVACFAQNIAGNATLSTDINVIEPDLPRISSGEGEIFALNRRQPVTASIGMTVQTFTGTQLTLECLAEGSPKPKVSWAKDGEAIDSKRRVSVNEDGKVIIKNTRVSDTGTYICEAKSVIGEMTEVSSVYVRAPIRPRIKVSRSYIIWYEKQPFKGKIGDNLTTLKGRTLTLTCPALGLPQPAIAWYRGGMRMRNGGNYVVIGNKLIMYNLDPMDTDRYTCVARNFAGVTSATTTLKVHDPMTPKIMPSFGYQEALQNHDPLNVTIGNEVAILQGSALTIKCPFTGVPEPKIKWIKDRKMLASNERMEMDCAGILNIFKMELEDSGDYACIAQSFLGMDMAFSAVTVFEAVKPSVDISGRAYVSSGSLVDMHVGDNLTAIITTPVHINCSARGTPKPNMRWQMNGKQLGNGGNYKTDNSGALEIKRLENPGEFKCIAENFLGKDGASSYINILDPVKPSIITPEIPKTLEPKDLSPITLKIGDNMTALTDTSITIQCPTSGVPPPSVTWTKDDKEILGGDRYKVQDDASLVIDYADENISGRYTCTSSNVAGNSSASSVVQIVEPVKPTIEVSETGKEIPVGDGSPVTMNIGDNLTAASNITITIRCPVSGVPTPAVSWTKDGVAISPGMQYSFTSDNSLVIKGAASDDSGKYTCSVKSVSGSNSASSAVEIKGPSRPVVKRSENPKAIEAQDRSPILLSIGDNVTALTNTSITIRCPTSGVPSPTVTWTKSGQEILIGDRYQVQDDGSLLIVKAHGSDSALYTCRADSVAGKDSASTVVQVVESISPTIDFSRPGKDIPVGDGSPVTMNIGDNVTAASNTTITIRCPVSGVPTPAVTWTKDGEELIPGKNIAVTSESALVIKQADVEDSATYNCNVQGLTGSDFASSVVKVLEHSKPSVSINESKTVEAQDRSHIVLSIGDNVTALTDTNITIQCPISGVPTPTVTWTKNRQEISSGDRYRVQDDGSLVIMEANIEDNAQYTCTANSVAGKDSKSSVVEINGLKKPTILVQQPTPVVSIGDGQPVVTPVGSRVTELTDTKITLTCPTEGSPPLKITWRKDGGVLSERYGIDKNGSLTIQKAQIQDTGNYTCSAQNEAGVAEVTSLVDILEPSEPMISPSADAITSDDHQSVTAGIGSKIDAFEGATVKITCEVTGMPKPNVQWTKDGQRILSGERVRLDSNGTLIIRRASFEDSGDYTCSAKSRAGQTSITSPVNVEATMLPLIVSDSDPIVWYKADPLAATIGSSIRTLSGVKISLTCPATGNPTPTVSWRKGGKTLSTSGLYLTISAADSDDVGLYTCVATNIAGSAEASSDIAIEAPTPPSIVRSVEEVSWDNDSPLKVSIGSRVNIVNGSSLILKCMASGLPLPELTWTRGIEDLTDGERYNISISEQTLVINDIKFADADEYTCSATNMAGQDAATTELVVKGPGGPEIFSDKRVIVDVNSSKPVMAPVGANITTVVNATVIMKCPNKGTPKPTVSWSHNQRFIFPRGRFFTNKSSLVIRGVRLSDAGSYQCTASNIFGRDIESLSLTVAVPPLISNVRGKFEVTDIRDIVSITTGAVVTILRGVAVRIKCLATGVPTPKITWYRNRPGMKKRYPVVQSEQLKVLYDHSLSISHAAVNDAAYFTCVATNVAGEDEGSTLLSIGAPPSVPSHWHGVKSRFNIPEHARRTSTGAIASVVRGATLLIKCEAEGNPKPTITWEVFTSNYEERHRVLEDGTLVVPSAELEDEGNYTCIANNSYGTLRRTTTVSILVPPEILDRHFRHISSDEKRIEGYAMAHADIKRNSISYLTIERGYNLMLMCTVVGKPTPVIVWSRNGQLIRNDSRHMILPSGVLLVRQVDTKESGQYKCVASNIVGKDQGSVRLIVKNEATGYWRTTAWSKCGNCVTHLRGWQERHISCMGPGGKTVSELHCIHKHKPSKRRTCIHRDCHVIWRTAAWSACSRSCGSHGVKLRSIQCVFTRSLKLAKGQCQWQKKPPLQEPCNRKSCIQANCTDSARYCQRIKQLGMCPVYSRWCCDTCRN